MKVLGLIQFNSMQFNFISPKIIRRPFSFLLIMLTTPYFPGIHGRMKITPANDKLNTISIEIYNKHIK